MFSSEKFLSASVTAGLPAPGWRAEPEVVAAAPLLDEVLLDFELLPHAASSTPTATAAASASTARARDLRIPVESLSPIRRLLFLMLVIVLLCCVTPVRPPTCRAGPSRRP